MGEADKAPRGKPQRDPRIKYGVLTVIGLLGIIFIAQNSESTTIHFLKFTFEFPLIFVLVGMVALGAGVDRALVWRGRRERS